MKSGAMAASRGGSQRTRVEFSAPAVGGEPPLRSDQVRMPTAVSDPHLAVAAALTYALAYTFELGLSLFAYFGAAG